jgi:S1-C subfamily serine protease
MKRLVLSGVLMLAIFVGGCAHPVKLEQLDKDNSRILLLSDRSVQIEGLNKLVIGARTSGLTCAAHAFVADGREFLVSEIKSKVIDVLTSRNIKGDMKVVVEQATASIQWVPGGFLALSHKYRSNAFVKIAISVKGRGFSPLLSSSTGSRVFIRENVVFCEGGSEAITKTLSSSISDALGSITQKFSSVEQVALPPQPAAPSQPSAPKKKSKPVEKSPSASESQETYGSGFFVSKLGHVITNAHVVEGCKMVTVGDSSNKQAPVEVVSTDKKTDLALLKLSSLGMASASSKSLIQKLGVKIIPLAANGLLRLNDVKLGEKVLVAGYPFGDIFSDTLKVTSGIVSATRGAGDNAAQFQLDAAVQNGNSGGPIYDSGGNIVGVVVSKLNKLKVAKAIGSFPENVNFGIKASTVKAFLETSGLPSKIAERTADKSTVELAEIAQKQALMIKCLQ